MLQKVRQFIFNISFILMFTLTSFNDSFAVCTILTSSGMQAERLQDGIGILLSDKDKCPKDVFAFREQIKSVGLRIQSTMVANRGYHNPSQGSFSFFEMVMGNLGSKIIQPGDFFFGHFTTVDENNELTADQGPTTQPRLMIEAFAWDPEKKLFNFYELRGDGNHNQWFYRGDSADIYADNTFLHRQSDPSHPQFGHRLRCSGCHDAGGPIMKELDTPHNDWWDPIRKLDFGSRKLNKSIVDIVANLVSPDRLSENVILGVKKLENQKSVRDQGLSLQEMLRPLFCPVEVNLMSDILPNEKNHIIQIPIEFFINKKLVGNQMDKIFISQSAYENALRSTNSHFPETLLSDADHAWLTPVKATSDQLAIDHLIDIGLIDKKFAFDVLSIDMTNPVFSNLRCGLLKYVPNSLTKEWKEKFIQELKASNQHAALTLLNELTNPSHTPEYHQQNGLRFLKNCIAKLKTEENIKQLFLLLIQRRVELKTSEISKNPLGQILEPGFRVIFPETDRRPVPGQWILTDTCEVKMASLRKH